MKRDSKIGKGLGAGQLFCAALEEQVHRPLRVAGQVERQIEAEWSDAVEGHGADLGAVLAQIDQRRARSIGAAPEIDLIVPEPLADLV